MNQLSIGLALLLPAFGAFALGTETLVHNTETRVLLSKKCIRTEMEGSMAIPFDSASALLNQPNLLELVQQEYARSVSEHGKVDIPVIETTPGQYHYYNNKGKRTDIRILHRGSTTDGVYDCILQASGKRFFGRYDVVVHFRMVEAGESDVEYVTQVHAYPHNGALRFFARKLGTIERYFKKNADKIGSTAQTIGEGLMEQQQKVVVASSESSTDKNPATL